MNEFEAIANEIERRSLTNETSQECCIEWIRNSKTATVTFPGNTKYASKIKKLSEEYPDQVKIRYENKDNSIVATIPTKFVKIAAPRKVSEEQKEAMRERMKQFGFRKKNTLSEE